jgi:hypothetical protein
MGAAVNNTAALYFPPRGAPLFGLDGFQPLPCTIVGLGPTGFLSGDGPFTVNAFVRALPSAGCYSAWVAQNVPYVDGTTDAADVPPNGGYVAPVGFTIPEPPAPPPDPTSATGDALLPGETIYTNPDTGAESEEGEVGA